MSLTVLVWHVHGSWLTALVQGPHRYLVPTVPGRGPDGLGRARTWDWPASVVEVAPEELRDTAVSLFASAESPSRETGSPPTDAPPEGPASQTNSAMSALNEQLDRWVDAGADAVLSAWRARDALRDREVAWAEGSGVAAGVDDRGNLLVRVAGGDLAARVGIRPSGEMGRLCVAVDRMADAVAEREEQLELATRQYVGNLDTLAHDKRGQVLTICDRQSAEQYGTV